MSFDDPDWASLQAAYGPAKYVPALLHRLNSPSHAERSNAITDLWGCLCHQGTVYEASAVAAPLLLDAAQRPNLSSEERTQLLALVVHIGLGADTTWQGYTSWTVVEDCARAVEALLPELAELALEGMARRGLGPWPWRRTTHMSGSRAESTPPSSCRQPTRGRLPLSDAPCQARPQNHRSSQPCSRRMTNSGTTSRRSSANVPGPAMPEASCSNWQTKGACSYASAAVRPPRVAAYRWRSGGPEQAPEPAERGGRGGSRSRLKFVLLEFVTGLARHREHRSRSWQSPWAGRTRGRSVIGIPPPARQLRPQVGQTRPHVGRSPRTPNPKSTGAWQRLH